MERTLTIGLAFAGIASLWAQAPAIEWARTLGGANGDDINAIRATSDGGYILASESTSNNSGDVHANHGYIDMWLVKLDALGDTVWTRCYGGTDEDRPYDILQTSDGGYVTVGLTRSSDGDITTGNLGNGDVWVVKVDASGSLQWQGTYGGSGWEYGYAIVQAPDGGYVLTGNTTSSDGDVSVAHGSIDVWVVKLSSGGGLEWQKTYGGSLGDDGRDIEVTSDGKIFVTGLTNSSDGDVNGFHGSLDLWVLQLNTAGDILWNRAYGGSGDEVGYGSALTPDGGLVVTGAAGYDDGDVSGNHGADDIWVLRLNASGGIEWQLCLGGSSDDIGAAVERSGDDFVVCGLSGSNDGDLTGAHGQNDLWALKLSGTGSLLWQKALGGTDIDGGQDLDITADGGCILSGYTYSNDGDITLNQGSDDGWVIKLYSSNVGLADLAAAALNVSFDAANERLMVRTPWPRDNALTLLDIMGRAVAHKRFAGQANELDTQALPRGTYLLLATNGSNTEALRVVLR